MYNFLFFIPDFFSPFCFLSVASSKWNFYFSSFALLHWRYIIIITLHYFFSSFLLLLSSSFFVQVHGEISCIKKRSLFSFIRGFVQNHLQYYCTAQHKWNKVIYDGLKWFGTAGSYLKEIMYGHTTSLYQWIPKIEKSECDGKMRLNERQFFLL